MQMKSVSKVRFGQLNDKRVYFSNGLLSLPYGHPLLTNVRKQKDKYRDIHKTIQTKKDEFLKEESKVIKKIPRLDILNQIFNQPPSLYDLQSECLIFSCLKTTKKLIKNGSWKFLLFIMVNFKEIFWLLAEQIAVKQPLWRSWG